MGTLSHTIGIAFTRHTNCIYKQASYAPIGRQGKLKWIGVWCFH